MNRKSRPILEYEAPEQEFPPDRFWIWRMPLKLSVAIVVFVVATTVIFGLILTVAYWARYGQWIWWWDFGGI